MFHKVSELSLNRKVHVYSSYETTLDLTSVGEHWAYNQPKTVYEMVFRDLKLGLWRLAVPVPVSSAVAVK